MSIRLQPASLPAAVLGAGLMLASASAAGEVQVRFVEPERFTDAHLDTHYGTDIRVLQIIEQHLQGLASRCLGSDQKLEIQVLDVDLAGRQEWWHRAGAYDLRVMREITWPRIDIAYILRREKVGVVEARERISDMNYLWNSAYVRGDSVPLPYERIMLTNWFERTFCR
jgi:hypothetical protein